MSAPRLLEALVARRLASDPHAASTLGDLAEGHAHRTREGGRVRADLWYARQTLSLLARGTDALDGSGRRVAGRGERWLHGVGVSLRALRRRPAFALTVMGVMAFTIAAVFAAFSVTMGTFEAARWWSHDERTLQIWPEYPFSRGQLDVLRKETALFDAVGGMLRRPVVVTLDDRSMGTAGVALSPEIFAELRARPFLGRGLEPEDGEPGREPVVVLGYGLWQRAFAGDPDVLGTLVEVSGERRRVVGVMPPGANQPGPGAEIWTPLVLNQRDGDFWPLRELEIVAVARAGVSPIEARDDVRRVLIALQQRFSGFFPADFGREATAVLSSDRSWGAVSTPLLLLLAGTTLLLLVAGIDIGNLALARSLERQTEMRVRVALGASRAQVVGQILAESAVLAGVSGIAGWGIGAALARQVPALFPFGSPVVAASATAPVPLLFAALVTLLSWILIGGVPAAHFLISTRRAEAPRRMTRVGVARWLVVTQAGLATVLLVTSALLLRTVRGLDRLPLGFDPTDAVAVAVAPSSLALTAPALNGLRDEIARRIDATPNVQAVGWISAVPLLDPPNTFPINREDQQTKVSEAPTAAQFVVDAGAIDVLRLDILQGRGFDAGDDARAEPVALINETMAKTLWPGRDPIGLRIAIDPHDWERWIRVVGVVRDVRYRDLALPSQPAYFLPRAQMSVPALRLVVRSGTSAAAVQSVVRTVVAETGPGLPTGTARSLAQVVRDAQGPARVMTWLLSVLAMLATALGAVGLYASLAGWVTRRRTEIGTRLALGASPGELSRGVLVTGLTLTTAGVLVGSIGAALAGRAVRGLLFGVSPLDPLAFMVPIVLLLATGLVAAILPAVRAARVPPAQALRQ